MAATSPDVESRTGSRSTTVSTELLTVLESDTRTITGAVAAGNVTVAELERFADRVERGEVDGLDGVDDVIRIVGSLLSDDAPNWEEMEPAGSPVRV
jgi:hypothetical protein